MASASVIGAIIERYATFTIASTAKLWFDEAPMRDTANTAVTPPYVVLKDDGTVPDFEFEYNPIEETKVRFEIYATGLASADAIASAIRYNGGAIGAGLGMDFAGSLPLTGQSLMSLIRQKEQRFQEGARATDGSLVYRVSMSYKVQTQRTA